MHRGAGVVSRSRGVIPGKREHEKCSGTVTMPLPLGSRWIQGFTDGYEPRATYSARSTPMRDADRKLSSDDIARERIQ